VELLLDPLLESEMLPNEAEPALEADEVKLSAQTVLAQAIEITARAAQRAALEDEVMVGS